MLYIRETGRRLGDHFREHLRDVKNNKKIYLIRKLSTLTCPVTPQTT